MSLDVIWTDTADVQWINTTDTTWKSLFIGVSVETIIRFNLFIKQNNTLDLLIDQARQYQLFIQQQYNIDSEF